jgi:predicted lactoylglutathione lyase
MKITPPSSFDEVKEVINGKKNYKAQSTHHPQAEGFRYGGMSLDMGGMSLDMVEMSLDMGE